jgi:hypothetical protein
LAIPLQQGGVGDGIPVQPLGFDVVEEGLDLQA